MFKFQYVHLRQGHEDRVDRRIQYLCKNGDKEVTISANREGLLSLARHFQALAEGVPGDHIHYDEHNSLEEGSSALIIERVE